MDFFFFFFCVFNVVGICEVASSDTKFVFFLDKFLFAYDCGNMVRETGHRYTRACPGREKERYCRIIYMGR